MYPPKTGRLVPRVSIITPVYNGAAYIGEAIESVLAQTWRDWELIVVDDGSTDATPDILQSFLDPRIVCIRQENQGEAGARNTGLDRARGEYIAFLDADDLYLPSALADLVAYMDGHSDVDVVYSDGIVCDANKRSLMRLSGVRPGIYTGPVLEQLILSTSVVTVPVCTMTRQSTIEACSVRFDTTVGFGTDWLFWVDLARHGQFGYLDNLTCMYRVHDTNMNRTIGRTEHKEASIRCQLKVLNAHWFQQLSTTTRHQFFYRLLVGLLADEPAQQQTILKSQKLRNLPPRNQAVLWRHVGADYLLRRSHPGFAVDCLQQALRLWPDDRRSQLLLWASRLSDAAPYHLLRFWRVTHKASERLRSLGRQRPKPVPVALGPVGD
jgi:hypothetical protein